MWVCGRQKQNKPAERPRCKSYTGVGSRTTPVHVLAEMEAVATYLEEIGYVLQTGCAEGADRAFLKGIRNGAAEVFIPEESRRKSLDGLSCRVVCPKTVLSPVKYSEMEALAAKTFEQSRGARWQNLKPFVQALHTRNMAQVLGISLAEPAEFLLCWTPDAAETSTSRTTGGTGQAIRCAITNGIPVINLGTSDWKVRLIKLLEVSNFQLITGNLWDHVSVADAVCITTNGFVKQRDRIMFEAVMGRGCAAQALKRYPSMNLMLGHSIVRFGNVPRSLCTDGRTHIVSFPVKPESLKCTSLAQIVDHQRSSFQVGGVVPGWACVADLAIIRESAIALVALADKNGWESIIVPRPGCGAGELNWQDVSSVLGTVPGFDSRFSVITYGN